MTNENIFRFVFTDYRFQFCFFLNLTIFSKVGYTTSSLQLRWSNISENAVALNQTSLPQFEVTGRNYSHRERTHRFRGIQLQMQIFIILKRKISYTNEV